MSTTQRQSALAIVLGGNAITIVKPDVGPVGVREAGSLGIADRMGRGPDAKGGG
jgi:hypothetical protein